MPKPDSVKCENCDYWERITDGRGLCHRYPRDLEYRPKMLLALSYIARHMAAQLPDITPGDIEEIIDDTDLDGLRMRPETLDFDWCGEFRSEWLETA